MSFDLRGLEVEDHDSHHFFFFSSQKGRLRCHSVSLPAWPLGRWPPRGTLSQVCTATVGARWNLHIWRREQNVKTYPNIES